MTLTARTQNSALPSVRKQINNIEGMKMLKDQLKKDNTFSIQTSPCNLQYSKEEHGQMDQFSEGEPSEIQQENSDRNMQDIDTVSLQASVQSNLPMDQ